MSARLQDKKAHVYVCGGSSMGADVMVALQDVAQAQAAMDADAAAAYIKQLQADGRYIQELWS